VIQAGSVLQTADNVFKDKLTIKAQGYNALQGIGSNATILQKDIAACGPSIIHIIDQILLPFTFDQAPKDIIDASLAPGPVTSAGK